MEDRAKRVYLHVGAPTAGDAFLHRALWDNRRRLGDAGVCYPLAGPMQHFAAVMDLREMSWGGRRDPAWSGVWDGVARRVRDWDGHTAVFSQGLLGGADEGQVRRAVESLRPAEVHVVFVTRHLGWQLVCDWQEQIRHNHTVTFERFVDDLVALGIDAPQPYGEMFWGLHDPVRVLRTWEAAVPRDRVHVLTLPAPGTAPGALWSRFRAVTGIGEDACDVVDIPEEEPLSAIEAEVLRRLNGRLGPALGGDYERVVRDHLVGSGLTAGAEATGHAPMGLPARHVEWMSDRSRRLADALDAAGYRVTGDLGELAASEWPPRTVLPGEIPEEQVAAAAIGVAAHLLERLNTTRDRIGMAHLHGQLGDIRDDLDQLLKTAASGSTGLQRAARRATGRRGS